MEKILKVARHTKFVRTTDTVDAQAGEELMLMSIKKGEYFSMNPTASLIWEKLAVPTSFGEVCDAVLAEFDVSAAHCETTAMSFVEKLLAEDLISVVG